MRWLILTFFLINQAVAYEVVKEPRAYISKKATFFTRAVLTIEGQNYETTLWGDKFEVADVVKSNSKAYEAASLYEKHMDRSSLYLWSGFGLAIIYLISTNREDFSDTIYWGVFGTGLGLSMYERNRANQHLTKMINFYNTDF